jgi:hypothetical protein
MATMAATKGDVIAPIAASVVLQRLHEQAPADHFTAVIVLTIEFSALRETIRGAKWIIGSS